MPFHEARMKRRLPSLLAAIALAATPALAQTASVVGLWGLTLIALLTLASPAVLADPPEATKRPWLLPAISAALLIALAGFGLQRLAATETASEGDALQL